MRFHREPKKCTNYIELLLLLLQLLLVALYCIVLYCVVVLHCIISPPSSTLPVEYSLRFIQSQFPEGKGEGDGDVAVVLVVLQ